jgi:predicted Zn-dependent protease
MCLEFAATHLYDIAQSNNGNDPSMRLLAFLLTALSLAACTVAPIPQPAPRQPSADPAPVASSEVQARARAAARQFVDVTNTVQPVAEAECRRVRPRANCDFVIVVDDRPNQPPNAFQTIDRAGRPILAFNLALILSARNADELAFVMGHEAAHHIEGHLEQTRQNAQAGAVIFSGLAALTGATDAVIESAQQIGATVGARSYSKDFELEADRLGTIITKRAGYDPVRGAQFFARIPDPGNRFLGTHPPNAARVETVRRTAAGL